MDEHILKLITERMDRMEDKIDVLLEFRWKIVGGTIVVSAVAGVIIQVGLFFLKGG